MPDGKQKLRHAVLLAEIDRKLAALPRDQQNLAAAFALGLRACYGPRRNKRATTPGRAPR